MREDFKGFTLVELVVVFAIFIVVTGGSIVYFNSFTNSQSMDSAAKEAATVLSGAKASAISQSLRGSCTQGLERYSVRFILPSQYELRIRCNSVISVLKNYRLPAGLSFDSGTSSEIYFTASSGLSGGGSVRLRDSTNVKVIQIDTAGNITIQ